MTLLTIALFAVPGSNAKALSQDLSARVLAAGIAASVALQDAAFTATDAPTDGLTLLAGSDPQAPEDDAKAVQALRTHLVRGGRPFQVLYGTCEERLDQAMAAVRSRLSITVTETGTAHANKRRPWVWACDKCSDPECERHLLSGLLAARA